MTARVWIERQRLRVSEWAWRWRHWSDDCVSIWTEVES